MLAFAGMIAGRAKDAGMKVPKDPDGEWDAKKYPHFNVYCTIQLGAPIVSPRDVDDNARIIAKIPNDKIKKVTIADLIKLGAHIHT